MEPTLTLTFTCCCCCDIQNIYFDFSQFEKVLFKHCPHFCTCGPAISCRCVLREYFKEEAELIGSKRMMGCRDVRWVQKICGFYIKLGKVLHLDLLSKQAFSDGCGCLSPACADGTPQRRVHLCFSWKLARDSLRNLLRQFFFFLKSWIYVLDRCLPPRFWRSCAWHLHNDA